MATHIREEFYGVEATADLSGFKYRAVTLNGTVAASLLRCAGILKTGCTSGGVAQTVMEGITKAQFGGAVSTIGWPITITTSGWAAAASSGGLACGRALETCNSGDIAMVAVNFNMPFQSVI